MYDGDGGRAKATSAAGTTYFFYSPDGVLLTEMTPGGHSGKDYLYLHGAPVAQVDWTVNEEDLGPVVRVGETSTEVVLDWSLYSGGASDVLVRHHQGLDMGGTFGGSTVVALVSAPTESFAAEVLADGEDHEYRVFALSREDELFFYRTDHLGTPIAMTNAQQNLVWRAEDRPFGDLGSLSMSEENDLRFPGQYFDVETGLHQNYFRDYDPAIGRYREPDPIGLWGGTNLFGYGGGNPVSATDPLGLAPGDWWDPRSYSELPNELNPLNSQGTFYTEAIAIGESFAGIVTLDWSRVQASAPNTPLGLTEEYGTSCDSFERYVGYYGTRAAVTAAGAASAAAASLWALEAAGVSNLGSWQLGWRGGEITLKNPLSPFKGPDFRLNPLGDWRSPNPHARSPHWHHRPGIGKHRPWEWWF